MKPGGHHFRLSARWADFVSQALAYRPLADLLPNRRADPGAMDRKTSFAAQSRSRRNRGVTFEAGLVERLLDDVGEEPGNLPLLQFALSELWLHREGDKLTHDAYDAIGGVGGARQLCRHNLRPVDARRGDPGAPALRPALYSPAMKLATRRPTVRTELGEDTWRPGAPPGRPASGRYGAQPQRRKRRANP